MFLYVLQLSSRKYYVGSTKNIVRRSFQHKFKRGAKWTKLFPMIDLAHLFYADLDMEDTLTLIVMRKYGIRNVRGGRWTREKLGAREMKNLHRLCEKLDHSTFHKRCMRCRDNTITECFLLDSII